jgi:iron complex outermembrane recepter protein
VRKQNNKRYRMVKPTAISAALAAILSPGMSPPAVAQSEQLEEVLVTGSRIARQDYIALSPIVTVDADTFANTSVIGIETVLNQLPQFVPAQTEFTETTLQATATTTPGASNVNLRGLGPFRTLTLIDGRRAQPLNANLAFDTNSIPSSAIERVEIISGGASAVYGADAVAGVVNFILKSDYEGMDLTARWGRTDHGDGAQLQISALLGSNFADGRGNVMLGLEHADRSTSYDIKRPWYRPRLDDPFVAGSLIGETYVDFAIEPPSQRPTQAAIDSLFTDMPPCTLPNGSACPTPNPNGKYFVNPTPDGTGTLFTGGAAFFGTTGHAGSYRYEGPWEHPDHPGLPFRKMGANNVIYEQLEAIQAINSVPLERYSAFAKAQFAFTDSVSAYLRGNFTTTRTQTKTSFTPAVNNWTGYIPVGFEGTLWEDSLLPDGTTNPAYLPGGTYGVNCPPEGGCMISEAFPLPPELEMLLRSREEPDADLRIHRVLNYFPERATDNRVQSSQVVLGFEGHLQNGWMWDTSVAYGVTDTTTLNKGGSSLAQYNALLRSPNYGVAFTGLGISPTSSGRGECTTGLPIFRTFTPSEDCMQTVSVDMQATGRLEQRMAEVNLVGDVVQLPAGTMQFALGAHYRDYDFVFVNDNINSPWTWWDQALGLFPRGNTFADMNVSEIYGELLIPVARDLPLMQQLNVEVGGRVSDYTTAGTVDTYKLLLDWVPTSWARVRGGFNRATRAPHIAEAFLGRSQAFISQSGDPCSPNDQNLTYSANPDRNPEIAPQVEQLCRALMTDTAATRWFETTPLEQLPSTSAGAGGGTAFLRGNPAIQAETADTYTMGLVLQSNLRSPWLSGLIATIDYYHIEIEDLIGQQSGDEVWRNCVFTFDPNSTECQAVFRDPFDGRMVLTEISYTNRGSLKYTGVDVQVNWNFNFSDFSGFIRNVPGALSVRSQITVPIDRTTQDGPTAPVREWVGTLGCEFGLNCSGFRYQAFTTFMYSSANRPWNVSLRWNHYPTIRPAVFATDPDTRLRGVFESYNLFSLAGSYVVGDRYLVRAGIDNLLDTRPPLSGGAFARDGDFVNLNNPPQLPTPAQFSGNARYDQYGRRFYMGAQISF